MFSRMVRSANTSARTVCSPVFGLVALSRTSRAHSLMVCSPARASNRAYSSSVTLVLIDLVRREGMEFTPSNQQVPIREPKVTARRSDGRGSRQAAEFSASSHIATKVAIRHPFGGDVSVQLPVPKAPLLAKRGANQRFALLTLFAILQLQLLHPPLKLGDRPRLLEQFAQSVPFGLSEVDTYIVLPKPKRECWPLLLG